MKLDRDLEVAKRAHAIWEQNGRPEGASEQHWFQAERELEAGNDNGAFSAPTEATQTAAKVSTSKEKPATSRKTSAKKAASAPRGKQARAATA